MSVLLSSPIEGELVLVRVRIESRQLEDVLESLAELPFPVNPDLSHSGIQSLIEFPAFAARIDAVRKTLESFGAELTTQSMLAAIQR
ncbi:MAG: hypothetical protein FJW30_21820 [Acidobacteria bacterium]|nr:hypothetical protein [Acidobacteriota bacterium]